VTDLPALRREELRHLVEQVFRGERRRSYLLAVHGTGEGGEMTTAAGEFIIRPVSSELELRDALPPIDLDNDARIVFLLPWDELPLDIGGRFAGRGRVQTLPRDRRLRDLLGVDAIDPAVWSSRLAGFLLRQPPERNHLTIAGAGRLTLDALWTTYLTATWRVPADLGLASMLAWAAWDGRGREFTSTMASPDAAGVAAELRAFLAARLGTPGVALWQHWETGRGRQMLAYAVLCEALADHPGAHPWLRLSIGKPELGLEIDAAGFPAFAETLRDSVPLAVALLEQHEGHSAVEAVLGAAETLLRASDEPAYRPLLVASPRLPSAWELRLTALGDALHQSLARRTPESLVTVEQALQRLFAHELFKQPDYFNTCRQAEMIARLLAWLIDRQGQRPSEGLSAYAPVESLARWYAEEGGHVDWARRRARPAAARGGRFGEAVSAVLAAADAARRELDLRFARALPDWLAASCPQQQVLPIDRAAADIGAAFLAGSTDRKLLVLLLDGMAWAQASELLESLGEGASRWAPLRWHSLPAHRIGDGAYPPVLASIPTITEVSRAAFFSGKPPSPGARGDTSDDPARWQKHSVLGKFFPPPRTPQLLLGSDAHTRDGTASERALQLIRTADERVVAIVINAIDDALKSNPQHEHEWKRHTIRSLEDFLRAAREAHRAVLLASDHGHVAGDHLTFTGTVQAGGSRWRPLDPAGTIDPPTCQHHVRHSSPRN
jgi:hypothetical protein